MTVPDPPAVERRLRITANVLPTVTIAADRTPVTEGGTASFTVSVAGAEAGDLLVIPVELEQEGEFARDSLPKTDYVFWAYGRPPQTVSVPTIDDGTDEPEGRIVARVGERDTDSTTDYAVGTPGGAEVVVHDNDLPEVTIAADRTPITEGGAASFTVSVSTPAPEGGLVVNVALSQEGEYTDTLPETRAVTVPAGHRTVGVGVAIIDDGVVEPEGKIVARVVSHASDYTVGTPGEAEVAVRDNDLPVVTIAADRTPITEGEAASFTVSVSMPAPEGGLVVNVALSQQGEFTDTLPETREVTVPAGHRTVGVSVATIDDGVVEPEGKIVARVVSHASDYTVGTPGEAEVVVRDNDLPVVTIAADRTPVTEGGTASFTVSVAGAEAGDLLVIPVELEQVGEFARDPLPKTDYVFWAYGRPPQTVSVPTIADGTDEPEGKIVARVRERDTDNTTAYAVGTPGVAEVVVRDDGLPAVTITADRTPVTEGEEASFTVSVSTPAPEGGLVVNVALSQQGEYTDTLPETRAVTVPAGHRTVGVGVSTIDDGTDEPEGRIVARVVSHASDYTVGAPGEAEVVMRDSDDGLNDLPAVTIAADRTPITEGEEASFTVSVSTPAPEGGLVVNVALSQQGEFTGTLPETREVTVPAGQRTEGVSVPTIDDGVVEPEGKIVARVVSHASDYTVGTPGEAEVVVRDNDLPVVTIAADRTPVTEGGTASFTVSVAGAEAGDLLIIPVELEQEGEFARDPLPKTDYVFWAYGWPPQTVSVPTIDDGTDEPEGRIVARVGERDTDNTTDYAVGTPGGAEVVVHDNDLPEVTIAADRTPITEGGAASFTVSVSTPAPEGGLVVNVVLSEEGEYTDTLPEIRAVTVPAGHRTVGVSVATIDDGVEEPEGRIVARVVSHATDYTVGAPGVAEVVVRDNDLPAVTIAADRTPITEGEEASFTVSVSTPAPEGGLVVNVALSQQGEFTGTLPETREVTVPAGHRTVGVSVSTIDDGVVEPEGKIAARVREHDTAYAVGTPGEAEVVVRDNDLPVVTIAADRTPVTEGGTASFTVSVAGAEAGDLLVIPVELEQVGEFARDPLPKTHYVTWAYGVPPQTVSVSTIDDGTDEPEGKIVARVRERDTDNTTDYAVGTPGEAEVVVRDNGLPAVTITADRTPVTEGEEASFTVSVSTPAPEGGLVVNVALSEQGEFTDTLPETRAVTVPAGHRTVGVSVSTIDDGTDEPEGRIVARVVEHASDYTVGAPGEAEVVMRDNDDGLNDLPAVTIAADRTPITEGEEASFTVSVSTPAPEGGLVVNVALSQQGEFTDTLPETRAVTVPAGHRTVGVSVATIDDGTDEPEGKIVARVVSHATDYTVGTPGEAEVVVRDNDLPVVTIAADRTPVTEGGTASFTVSVAGAEAGDLLVIPVELEQEGEFARDPLPKTHYVTWAYGVPPQTVSVPTIDDGTDEPEGRIVARVGERDTDSTTDYAVGTPGVAEVEVHDNDLPAVTITADRTPITEGETASFTVSVSTPAPEGGLVVNVALSQQGEYTDTLPETRAVTVPAGQRTEAVSVPTIDDGVVEPEGRIVARVVSHASDYTVGTPGVAEVAVHDSDNRPPEFHEGDESIRYLGEETAVGTQFGAPVSATDEDADTLTYTLEGRDAENFAIDAGTGQLRTGTSLEFETKSVHEVVVSVSDGRGGSDRIEVEVRVLNTLTTVPEPSAVERRLRVTANRASIDEGAAVTFSFASHEAAPAGGLKVYYSLKQLAVDDDANAYDFRPLPGLSTHHRAYVTIPAGGRSASARFQTESDEIEETDVLLVVDIGIDRVSSFDGESCHSEGGSDSNTLTDRLAGCWASVDVLDQGGTVDRPEPIPFARYASVFPGHVPTFTGQNYQYINAGDSVRLTISLNIPAPRGGLEIFYSLYETASDFIGDVPMYPNFDGRSVTIPEYESEVFLTIPTRRTDTDTEDCENQGREGAGCITARIATPPYAVTPGGQTYLPYLHAPSELRYAVTTIVRPAPDVLPTATIAADRTPVKEGETASFTVSVAGAEAGDLLIIPVELEQVGEFARDPLPKTDYVFWAYGWPPQTVSVPTIDDGVVEPEGKIVARVGEHDTNYTTAYAVGAPGVAEVEVHDNDLPAVTITADRTPITEGETASFTVSVSTPAPEGGLVVNVVLSEEGEFTDTLPEIRAVTVPAGQRTEGVSVSTIDDGIDEPEGKIVARVLEHASDYTVGAPGVAEVVVRDNDEPEVTIAADRTPITEGETASFTVSVSTPAPEGGLVVNVALSQQGEFTDTLPETRAVAVPAGQRTEGVSVPTIDDGVEEPEGKIVARVVSHASDYTVGTPGEAEVVVRDNDDDLNDLPAVTIAANRTPITEGEEASFTVSVSTPAPEGGLVVNVALSEEGEFTDTLPETREVTVPAGQRTVGVGVSTIDDGTDEPEGKIVARVAERDTDNTTDYAVGTPGEAEVVVRDNDDDLNDLPEVTITADRTPITEGEEASFTVSVSTPAPEGGLVVNVVLSEEGEYTDTLPEIRAVTVSAGHRTEGVSVSTVDDGVEEPDGKIVARVVEHASDYIVGTPGEAEVMVRDNDDDNDDDYDLNYLPVVTIAADRTPITEGEEASFTVSVSTPAPEGGLVVNVALSQQGEFTDTLPETREVTVPAGHRTVGVSVATIDDGVEEPDGKIVARVVSHASDYTVGTPGEAEVVVHDNDEQTEDEPTETVIGQVVPRLGRTIAGIVIDAIDCERIFRFPEDHATIGGLEVLPRSHVEEGLLSMDLQDADSWDRDGHRDENWMSEDAALQNSSFAVTSGDRGDGTSVVLWAKGALTGFTGGYKALSLHGNVVSGVAGVEHIGRDRRSGIAVAQSTGVIEYSLPSFGSGTARASLTSLHPYRCWFASDDTWMWATLGYGSGIASFSGLANVDRVNTSMRMGALGMTRKLLTQESWELVWKASAFAVSMGIDEFRPERPIRGDVLSFRGMFESIWEHEYESGAVLHSSLEVGGRYDGGDAEAGGSLALGGGVRYTAPDERGLTAEVNGHGLAQHGDSALKAWGIDGKLRFSWKTRGRDLSLEFDVGHGSRSDTVRPWLEPDAVAPLRGEAQADAGVRVGVRLNRGGLELGRLGSVVHHVGFDSGPLGPSVNTGVKLALDCCPHFALEGVYAIEPRRERIASLGLRHRW